MLIFVNLQAAEEADHALHKNEEKEAIASRKLTNAERKHDIALANVKSAEADVRVRVVHVFG
jgi:hypothetical protein